MCLPQGPQRSDAGEAHKWISLFLYNDTFQSVGSLRASLRLFVLQQQQNLGRRCVTSKIHLSPLSSQWLRMLFSLRRCFCCCLYVVDLLLIVTPVVDCYSSCGILYLFFVHSSCDYLCLNHLDGEERAGCFA